MLDAEGLRSIQIGKQNALTNVDDRVYGSESQDREHDGSEVKAAC